MKTALKRSWICLDLLTLHLIATTSTLSMTCYYLYFYLSASIAVPGIEGQAWPILKLLCQLKEPQPVLSFFFKMILHVTPF